MKTEDAKDTANLEEAQTFFGSLRFQPTPAQLQQHESSKAVLFILDDCYRSIFCRMDLVDPSSANSSEIFGMQELKPDDKLSPDRRSISIQLKDKTSQSRLEIGCSIFSDSKTIAGLCRGKVRPMSAFLSGKLKIEGDRKYFAIVALALKESMNKRNMEASTNSVLSPSNKLTRLRVRILNAYKDPLLLSLNKDKSITRYVLKVTDSSTHSSWQTAHRYSDFVRLRQQLSDFLRASKKKLELPKLNGFVYSLRPIIIGSTAAYDQRIIEERITCLQTFINALIGLFGEDNAILNSFLGNDQRGVLLDSLQLDNQELQASPSSHSSPSRSSVYSKDFSSRQSLNSHFNRLSETLYVSDESESDDDGDDVNSDGYGYGGYGGIDETGRKNRQQARAVRAVLNHASQPISWRFGSPSASSTKEPVKSSFSLSSPLLVPAVGDYKTGVVDIQEVLTLRSSLKKIEEDKVGSNNSSSGSSNRTLLGLLSTVVPNLSNGFVATIVSLSFHIFTSTFCLILALTGCSRGTVDRRAASLYGILIGVVFVSLLSISSSRGLLILYSVFWAATLSLVTATLNAYIVFTSEVATGLLRLGSTIAHVDLAHGALTFMERHLTIVNIFHVAITMGKSFLSAMKAQIYFVTLIFASITEHSPFVMLLTIFTVITIIAYSRDNRAQRAVYIYCLGCGLIAFYASVQITCNLLRLSKASKTVVFEYLDYFIAPYITFELGRLRSIFVKFAQYFGARSDVVSSVWTESLSKLQDACPCSSSEYVKSIIEKEFNRPIEEVFTSFDMTPIASASIAQVHTATVNVLAFDKPMDHREDVEETDPSFDMHAGSTRAGNSSNSTSIAVVVKVQHDNVKEIMTSDMTISIKLAKLAARLDSRWEILCKLLEGWKKTMDDELDFNIEARNMMEMRDIMVQSKIGAVIPDTVTSLTSRRVLVMTRLYGYKIKDLTALRLYGIDKSALVSRIAHSCAYQLLVKGVFNADPHPGNILVCLQKPGRERADMETKNLEQPVGSIVPGLLDYGMTVRIDDFKRRAYCLLIVALFEGDFVAAGNALQALGYKNSQSERAPERDAEFFEYLFRDANPKGVSQKEVQDFYDKRERQKKEDIENNVREKGGRSMKDVPEDFIFLTRVIGLLRGLTAELECNCPIMVILALHARLGLVSP